MKLVKMRQLPSSSLDQVGQPLDLSIAVSDREEVDPNRHPSVAESFQPARRCSWSWSQAVMVENTPVAYRAGSADTAHRGGA
jgi:hypothetical protein